MSIEPLRVQFKLDVPESLRRGFSAQPDARGWCVLDIPSDLPAQQRELIAANILVAPKGQHERSTGPVNSAQFELNQRISGQVLELVREPTINGIVECLTTVDQMRRGDEAKKQAAAAEREAVDREQKRQWDEIITARRTITRRVTQTISVGGGESHVIAYDVIEPIEKRLGFSEYLRSVSPEWEAELSTRNAAAEKAAKDELKLEVDRKRAEVLKEELAWIAAHGSARLKRMVALEIEYRSVYFDERLTIERPGWQYWSDIPGEESDPRNVPAEAFDVLDQALVLEPTAKLYYWKAAREQTDPTWGTWDGEGDYRTGYVAIATYLGVRIVFGGPHFVWQDQDAIA